MMKRNSKTLFLKSLSTTTPIPWINDAPDFSRFTEPTLSVLQKSWNDFVLSGEELEIIPDPEPAPEPLTPNWQLFGAMLQFSAPGVLSDLYIKMDSGVGFSSIHNWIVAFMSNFSESRIPSMVADWNLFIGKNTGLLNTQDIELINQSFVTANIPISLEANGTIGL
ncbi:hypothetical protein kac65v162_gp040 [Nodularia phage vB_NspS-kac65v162]|jgi:hypothetical protein|uniref:Uncharacterized protein n=1 Tax=Nodularia phage vB_NspS-kac65v162 TaxID=2557581 RepID=A0A482MIB5_9CAUD|nr:hypothetical protein kac65v162_gp040 [Nodularia phage vB_NspS-kac65v162]